MIEQLRNALAQLVALEARVTELVEPEKAITDSVKAIVLTLAQAYEQIHAQMANIEAQVRIIGEHPALSIPAIEASKPITATEISENLARIESPIATAAAPLVEPAIEAIRETVEAAQPKIVDPPRTPLGVEIGSTAETITFIGGEGSGATVALLPGHVTYIDKAVQAGAEEHAQPGNDHEAPAT